MGMVKMWDGLRNLASGLGVVGQDKQAATTFVLKTPSRAEIDACYRTTWLGRKIHDIPAKDMTREWRSWQAEDNQIELIENEEKRLHLADRVKSCLILARLYGGAALVLGLPGDVTTPAPAKIGRGALSYVHVAHRHQLNLGQQIADPADPMFGMPEYFERTFADGRTSVKIHPSRVIPFVGQALPEGAVGGDSYAWFWGDPLLYSVIDALGANDTTTAAITALLNEAKTDVIHIPGLMESLSSSEYETRLLQRLQLAGFIKSVTNALVLDGGDGSPNTGEQWETRQLNMSGLPELQQTMFQLVSGAADIPATRLIGQSPAGMNATGDSDTRNYYDMLASEQESGLTPVLAPLDEWLIMSATGSRDPSVFYEWNPLWQMTPKEKAERDKLVGETAKIYADMGAVPDEALAAGVQNRLIEDGVFPGLEAAIEEAERQASMELDPNELDLGQNPAQPSTATANDPGAPGGMNSRRKAANDRSRKRIRDKAMRSELILTDALPRPLYVSRKVLNGQDIVKWAEGQGFKGIMPAEQMHVTIAFSREPVDWMKVEASWNSDANGRLTIPAGGPRVVERLGRAVVLLFNSWELSYRHGAIREAGASWDFSDYHPHVSIIFTPDGEPDLSDGPDLEKIVPYSGKIELGPEVFEPLNEDWSPA